MWWWIAIYDVSPVDGLADSTTPYETVSLRQMQGIWEAGKKLALRDISSTPRNLITWVDLDNDGVVDSGEQMAFSTANASTLSPYLRAASSGTLTATNIINFIHGTQVSGMRNRQVTVNGALHVWKLGDVVNSTPTIVGAPKERYDILYGDSGYRNFVSEVGQSPPDGLRRRERRPAARVQRRLLSPRRRSLDQRCDGARLVHHEPTDNSSGTGLGEEVWGFVPYHLLPQLQWYTRTDYTHVSYVDLKPKVTDVRIFTRGRGLWRRHDADSRRLHPSGRVGYDLDRRPSVRRKLRVLRLCVLRQQRRSGLTGGGRFQWQRQHDRCERYPLLLQCLRRAGHYGSGCDADRARCLFVVRSRVDHQLSHGGPHESCLPTGPRPTRIPNGSWCSVRGSMGTMAERPRLANNIRRRTRNASWNGPYRDEDAGRLMEFVHGRSDHAG